MARAIDVFKMTGAGAARSAWLLYPALPTSRRGQSDAERLERDARQLRCPCLAGQHRSGHRQGSGRDDFASRQRRIGRVARQKVDEVTQGWQRATENIRAM